MSENPENKAEDANNKTRAWLESLPPEELEKVRAYAWDRILRSKKVNVDGKQMSLRALADDVEKQRQEFERGLYNEDVRTRTRSDANKAVPSRMLRSGSRKQMLRPDEEDALQLQRVGHGNCFLGPNLFGVPLPWNRACSFGIYARPDHIEAVIGPTWSVEDPDTVLDSDSFYNDILRRCNQVELTLMLLTSKPLKIKEFAPIVRTTLQHNMERLSGNKPLLEDENVALDNFIHLLDESRLKNTGLVEDGAVPAGTHFIVSTDPRGGLSAEAITPGTLSERKTSYIGTSQNYFLTAAIFDAFIGPNAVDKTGRRQTGRGILWAAHGLPFKPSRGKDFTVVPLNDDGSVNYSYGGIEERFTASTQIFSLASTTTEKPTMLLNKISSMLQ